MKGAYQAGEAHASALLQDTQPCITGCGHTAKCSEHYQKGYVVDWDTCQLRFRIPVHYTKGGCEMCSRGCMTALCIDQCTLRQHCCAHHLLTCWLPPAPHPSHKQAHQQQWQQQQQRQRQRQPQPAAFSSSCRCFISIASSGGSRWEQAEWPELGSGHHSYLQQKQHTAADSIQLKTTQAACKFRHPSIACREHTVQPHHLPALQQLPPGAHTSASRHHTAAPPP
jgi:hypothetical protein